MSTEKHSSRYFHKSSFRRKEKKKSTTTRKKQAQKGKHWKSKKKLALFNNSVSQ